MQNLYLIIFKIWYLIILLSIYGCKERNYLPNKSTRKRDKNTLETSSGTNIKKFKPKLIERFANKNNDSNNEKKNILNTKIGIKKENTINQVKEKNNNNSSKYVTGFNVYMECKACDCKQWVKFGCGLFDISFVECKTYCCNCKKKGYMKLLKFLGVGPSKFEYHFVCRDANDEYLIEKNKGLLKNKKQQSFDFLFKYPSWEYGEMKFVN